LRARVDDPGSRAIFVIPPEAGLQKSRDKMKLVLADFRDCKLKLNFVPGMIDQYCPRRAGLEIMVGAKVEFF